MHNLKFKKIDILIVEDETIIAFDLKLMLERLHCNVLGIANSGERAIALIKNAKPDLIILDIKLKGKLSGYDTAEWIEKKYRIPIVFMTAYSKETITDTKLNMERFWYLGKPFNSQKLEKVVQSVCLEESILSANYFS